jgi:hypothetical protein
MSSPSPFATLCAAVALILVVGCEPAPGDSDTGPATEDGCVLDPGHFSQISVEPTAVPTVFEALWTTAEPALGQVSFGVGAERWTTALEESPGTEHRALLVGSPALSEVTVQLVSELDGQRRCSDTLLRETPAPPSELPVLTVDPDDASLEPGGWAFVPIGSVEGLRPVGLDPQGRYCWWWDGDGYYFYADVNQAGDGLLLLDSTVGADSLGRVLEVGFDGEIRREVEVQGAHNHLVGTPDGYVYILGREVYEAEVEGTLVELTSDTVIEVAPDDSQRTIWSAREELWEPLETLIASKVDQGRPPPVDWSHGTSLDYDPEADRLLVLLTGADTLVALDRGSAESAWILGGEAGTLDLGADVHRMVSIPHSVQALGPDGVLLYNQSVHREGEDCGEASELALDVALGQVSQPWTAREPDCGRPDILGSAHRTDDGLTLMAGGTLGRLSWFDEQGELVWRIQGELGTTFGGASHVARFE